MAKRKSATRKQAAELSEQQVKKLSDRILRLTAESDVEKRRTVGEWLFSEVFGGSEEAFRSRIRSKGRSVQKLAAQPGMSDAGWTRHTLDQAIELFLLAKAFQDLSSWPHLQPSHFEQVFGLETGKQKVLLDKAEKSGWTVKQIAEATGKHWAGTTPNGAPRSLRTELAFGQMAIERLSSLREGLGPLILEAKVGVTTAQTTEFYGLLMEMKGLLDEWQTASGIEPTKPKTEMVPIAVGGMSPGEGPNVSVSAELLELLKVGQAAQAKGKRRR